jgi:hypothetical protein
MFLLYPLYIVIAALKSTKFVLFTLPSLDLSVGLQGSCILFLDPDRFDLTVGGSPTTIPGYSYIFQATVLYSRLPFRSITDYLTHGNALIYLYLDLQSESNHLFLHLVFDPSCATDKTYYSVATILSGLQKPVD